MHPEDIDGFALIGHSDLNGHGDGMWDAYATVRVGGGVSILEPTEDLSRRMSETADDAV